MGSIPTCSRQKKPWGNEYPQAFLFLPRCGDAILFHNAFWEPLPSGLPLPLPQAAGTFDGHGCFIFLAIRVCHLVEKCKRLPGFQQCLSFWAADSRVLSRTGPWQRIAVPAVSTEKRPFPIGSISRGSSESARLPDGADGKTGIRFCVVHDKSRSLTQQFLPAQMQRAITGKSRSK